MRPPVIYAQFEQIVKRLETHFREMQDMEFTVEKGKLWMLQTRSGKRTAQAALLDKTNLDKDKPELNIEDLWYRFALSFL